MPAPVALLAALSVLSLVARVAWVDEPCRAPCRSSVDHVLVFDEAYYVNAARVIAGVAPPRGADYATAPLGDDPNSEHPQLGKLLIAGSIELFGDGPLAWRLTSIVFGSLAIVGMFLLVRAAGGGNWLALGAASLMAFDNLLIVHGRIGTLDVPAMAMMVWAGVLYLRGHPLLAGGAIGIGACLKLIAPYLLFVLVLLELLRVLRGSGRAVAGWRPAGARLGSCAAAAAGVFVGLLAVLDRIAPPFDPVKGQLVGGGVFGHIAHMLRYGANQSSPHGPRGIASYPWTWLVDFKPITYLNINPSKPSPGLYNIHPAVHFLGMISPPIMLLALPSLLVVAWGLVAKAGDRRASGWLAGGWLAGGWPAQPDVEVPVVGLAWFLGTFLPFVALAVIYRRTSYLYYMVPVMPGIYMTVSWLMLRVRPTRRPLVMLSVMWATTVVAAAVVMYPLTPLPLG